MVSATVEWDDFRIFLNAVRAGNYTAAAERLNVNRTTVGRRVNQLEAGLGLALFELAPSGYRPTAAGRAVLESAQRIERELEELASRLAVLDTRLAGAVRVAVPSELGDEFMSEFAAFRRYFPEIRLELSQVHDPMSSLTLRKVDVALCVARALPSHLRGSAAGILQRAVYAAEGYRERLPTQDTPPHEWIGWSPEMIKAQPAEAAGHSPPPEAAVSITVDSWGALKEAVLCGLGVSSLWCFSADADRRLVRLQEPDPAFDAQLWLLQREGVPPDACTDSLSRFLLPLLRKRIGVA